jgi:hypothetical protein
MHCSGIPVVITKERGNKLLDNIFFKFGIHMKLVWLIQLCLNVMFG